MGSHWLGQNPHHHPVSRGEQREHFPSLRLRAESYPVDMPSPICTRFNHSLSSDSLREKRHPPSLSYAFFFIFFPRSYNSLGHNREDTVVFGLTFSVSSGKETWINDENGVFTSHAVGLPDFVGLTEFTGNYIQRIVLFLLPSSLPAHFVNIINWISVSQPCIGPRHPLQWAMTEPEPFEILFLRKENENKPLIDLKFNKGIASCYPRNPFCLNVHSRALQYNISCVSLLNLLITTLRKSQKKRVIHFNNVFHLMQHVRNSISIQNQHKNYDCDVLHSLPRYSVCISHSQERHHSKATGLDQARLGAHSLSRSSIIGMGEQGLRMWVQILFSHSWENCILAGRQGTEVSSSPLRPHIPWPLSSSACCSAGPAAGRSVVWDRFWFHELVAHAELLTCLTVLP